MALGVVEDVTWKQETVQLAPGDVLLLYTDGIIEAQNLQQAFFDEKRLLETAQANRGRSAQDMQDALIAEVHGFVGDAPQFDDITLMVVVRGSTEEQTDGARSDSPAATLVLEAGFASEVGNGAAELNH